MRSSTTHRRIRPLGLAALPFLTAVALAPACGRTGIPSPPAPPPPPICVVDSDCPTYGDLCKPVTCQHIALGPGDAGATVAECVNGQPVNCDDNDPCTKDTCNSNDGSCSYTHVTPDNDGDGYYAPLPGFAPGSPGSCGDDCDDTNPNAHPGGTEVCDGVDNDCDGIIDNGAVYLPTGADPVQINGPVAPAGPGGFAWSGQSYAASYTGTDDGFNVYLSTLTPTGTVIDPPGEQVFTLVNADAEAGPVIWNGDRYGTVWQDRRFADYEIFFNTLGADGVKQMPDVRLTNSAGFSVNPSLAWNGTEFVVAWQDDRNGSFDVFVQRVGADGTPDGDNLQLTQSDMTFDNESPIIAPGVKGVGITWSFGDSLHNIVDFQIWSPDLSEPLTPVIMVTDGSTQAVFPVVVWNKDRYMVAWYDKTASPQAIYATTYLDDGTQLNAPQPITTPGSCQSRYPFLRALGDRVLVVYSDDRDQNDGYEIYTRTVHSDLTPLGSELRVTNAPRDSVFPLAAFGPKGDFGVFFRDDRLGGVQNVWFTPLTCSMQTGP